MKTLSAFLTLARATVPLLAVSLCCLKAAAQSPTVTGYNGSQIFKTAPGKDPDEPNVCGVVGGSSYWFCYRPPTNGCVSLNTDGSSYDTLLAVFVDDGRNLGYASLLTVVCDDNSGTNGRTSAIKFTAAPKTNYYIMLDGVNGACGTAHLNYKVNQRPSISIIAAQSICEDAATTINFTVSDREYAASNLTVVGISTNLAFVPQANMVLSGTTSNRTAKVTPKGYGTNYVMLMVSDPGGASNIVSFLLRVAHVNHKPVAYPDTVTRLTGKAITISRNFPPRNDRDVDGDKLTVTAVASKSVGGVAITLNATNIIYSASSIYNSSDRFTYTVSDGKGGTATGTNYVNVSNDGVTIVY